MDTIKESPIHKGLVVQLGQHPGLVKVWIPTANSIAPFGQSEYVHQNTGSALANVALSDAIATAYTCRVATPLTSGSWFKEVASRGASVFNHWFKDGDDIHDYRIACDYLPKHSNGLPRTLSYNSDTPAQSLCVVNPTLNQSGGTPLPNLGQMPPGNYPRLEVNQWVLVAFINSSIYPVVIASLPSEEAWSVILGY